MVYFKLSDSPAFSLFSLPSRLERRLWGAIPSGIVSVALQRRDSVFWNCCVDAFLGLAGPGRRVLRAACSPCWGAVSFFQRVWLAVGCLPGSVSSRLSGQVSPPGALLL